MDESVIIAPSIGVHHTSQYNKHHFIFSTVLINVIQMYRYMMCDHNSHVCMLLLLHACFAVRMLRNFLFGTSIPIDSLTKLQSMRMCTVTVHIAKTLAHMLLACLLKNISFLNLLF